ncbi:MAG: hypothetical protein GY847_38165 [Proteobacteria bacterium]|nr:hypothetical protein [Pseudomonadota bacterium]
MKGFVSPVLNHAAGAVLLGLAVFVLIATARLFFDGRRHLSEALRLKDSGARPTVIAELEDAVKAYVPGSPYPASAIRELEILAKGAEMRGDSMRATAIWEVSRRAILATRHFRQPFIDKLKKAEQEITRLRNVRGKGKPTESNPVERPEDPDPIASLLLFIGLMGWIGGAITICLKPRGKESQSVRFRVYTWTVCLSGLALWIAMAWIAG